MELFKEGRIDGSKVRLTDGENEGMIVRFELGNNFWGNVGQLDLTSAIVLGPPSEIQLRKTKEV